PATADERSLGLERRFDGALALSHDRRQGVCRSLGEVLDTSRDVPRELAERFGELVDLRGDRRVRRVALELEHQEIQEPVDEGGLDLVARRTGRKTRERGGSAVDLTREALDDTVECCPEARRANREGEALSGRA